MSALIKLEGEQLRFATTTSDTLVNMRELKNPIFNVISASPGSGKTTTLISTLMKFVDENENLIDSMLDAGEKLLILVFNKNNKLEIEKKLKAAGIPLDLFEISTVHSLFFRHIANLSGGEKSKLGGFVLDYTRGFFSKNMVEFAMKSLCKGQIIPTESGIAEENLGKKRIFDGELVTSRNIEKVWSLVNGYFSSPYKISQIKNIEDVASFFGKRDVSVNDIFIPEGTRKTLALMLKKTGKSISEEELLLRIIIERIMELATFKEVIRTTYSTEETVTIPVVEEVKIGDFDDIEIVSQTVMVVNKAKVKEDHQNVFKVPHSYYYKEFLRHIIKDTEMMKAVFGKYRGLFLDEAQDNDKIFYIIAEAIAKAMVIKYFAFIGDSFQSINGFASPDHFDILKHIIESKEALKQKGIDVEEYTLNQTYRFGHQVEKYINPLFGSSVEGLEKIEDFIYPHQVNEEKAINILKKISDKNSSSAIICRSNAEASRLFVELQKKGYSNVRLESSAKKEITEFVKKGLMSIEDEHLRLNLYSALARQYGKKKMKEYSYKEVLACEPAKQLLRENGFAQLVRYSAEEVDNYIAPRNKSGHNITWIGTSHIFKGAEYDYIFLAGDYFKRDLAKLGENNGYCKNEETVFEDDIYSMLADEEGQESEKTETKMLGREFFDILWEPRNIEEKNILYVAFTRAKKGVFFMESLLAEYLLREYNLDIKLNMERYKAQVEGIDANPIESTIDRENQYDLSASLFEMK